MVVSPSPSEPVSGRSKAFIPLEYVEAYTFRAVDRCKAGDEPGAIVALGKALAMDPANEQALLLRGALWLLRERPGKAIRDFSKALARNSRNPAAFYKRGEAHQLLGHFRAAIADYSRVLLLDTHHFEALLHRAVLYSYFHQVDRALSDFDRLMATDPRIAKALARWGVKKFLNCGS
jgi:tetratricopeptide (TPR) repeat protein